MPKKQRKEKKKVKRMPENEAPAPEPLKTVQDVVNRVTLEITKGDGQSLNIYIKAPVLAEVIRKMAPGNYVLAEYAEPFKPILMPLDGKKDRVVTRPAVTTITKLFSRGSDWSWETPRAALVYNPDKLVEGFTINVKLDAPVAHDTLRKWGKMFNDGCKDIIASAKPFKMAWVLDEVGAPTK